MPKAIARTCVHPGCPERVQNFKRRCPRHEIEDHRHNERRTEKDPFYRSKAWQNLRLHFLHRFPMCAVPDCGLPARVVDHIKPIRNPGSDVPNWQLAYDLKNLQGMCQTHHNQKRQRESVAARKARAEKKVLGADDLREEKMGNSDGQ